MNTPVVYVTRHVVHGWHLAAEDSPELVAMANAFLLYVQARNFSPRTQRTYAHALVGFHRWLATHHLEPADATTSDILGFIADCRTTPAAGRGASNVVDLTGRPLHALAPATINLRVTVIAGMYTHHGMLNPDFITPIPEGRHTNWFAPGERNGMLAHLNRVPKPRSRLRLRTPHPLPTVLKPVQAATLLASLRTTRDVTMAALMLYSGLRSCEVLGLHVKDVDLGGRWLIVNGKGGKERKAPF